MGEPPEPLHCAVVLAQAIWAAEPVVAVAAVSARSSRLAIIIEETARAPRVGDAALMRRLKFVRARAKRSYYKVRYTDTVM